MQGGLLGLLVLGSSLRTWCDAKQIIEAYGKDGYKIMNDKSSLMICWHERPLYAVSAWIS